MSTNREQLTFGNWRRPASIGLFGLGQAGTFLALGGVAVGTITIMLAGVFIGLVVFAVIAVLIFLVVRRDKHQKSLVDRSSERVGFARAKASGTTTYRSGPLGKAGWGTNQLPGLAAPTRLRTGVLPNGDEFAIIYWPRTRQHTIVLAAEPDGAGLVDQEQIDGWVGGWESWLRNLDNERGLDAVSVCVETAPDTGVRLAQEVHATLDPHADEFAKAVVLDLVDHLPAAAASTVAYVTLTYNSQVRVGGKRRTDEQMARDLALRIPGLCGGLIASGAGAARPLSAQRLCEVIRRAYDPAVAELIDQAYANGSPPLITWQDVGPVGAEAAWDHYRHDSGVSVTWQMTEAPTGLVRSSILSALLSADAEFARKRVTFLYRPIDRARAKAMVEADVKVASFLSSTSEKPSRRALAAQRSALATAEEEAGGAGLGQFAMLVTATALDPASLDDMTTAVEHLGAESAIQLRPVYGSQDSAFVAALPLGLVPSRHLRAPKIGGSNA
ncbi:hypothetical protein ATK17_3925 [Branchiibius hedensis]|uniref:Integral membrane protein n=1 Tax=Branchiibius hedensis TaxID=672460 RepID=A0A2Y9BPK5_9MICO|nr:SCO6880 family protein [Branchiibius hedensis]PWJ23034.1 hypothetical protein ATK17_3925 [Branchiibius hedensis]SSA59110.1 hypothetical protein SAMN04489750_3925 [Branchiibius hedensis]